MASTKLIPLFLLASCALWAGGKGGRAEYAGGTISQIPPGCSGNIQAVDEAYFVFFSNKARWRVPYDKINLIEYGQKANRRYISAVFLSPLFLMSKSRQHFLTVGYTDEAGRQQAMIFKVSKSDIRIILVSLEARTGRKVEFQDEEARKAGKG